MSAAASEPVAPSRPNNLILTSFDSSDVVDPGLETSPATPQWMRNEHIRQQRYLTDLALQQ